MLVQREYGPVRGFRLCRALMGKGWYYTACYHVDGLMVDSGCAHTVGELLAALEGQQVHTVVNTHAHEDHVAANRALQERHGARVLAHALAVPMLSGQAPRPRLFPYQWVLWGWPQTSRVEEAPEWVETPRHRFQVLHTPGHGPDHICLYEPSEGWLFCGDAYVGGRDRGLRRGYDIWGIIAGIKRMASLEVARLFTGSGSVLDNPRQELLAKVAYLEEKGQEVLHLHAQGWPVGRIRKKQFGKRQQIDYITTGDFTGGHLVRSYLGGR